MLAPAAAPGSWHQARLPGGAAVMPYPPSMHPVSGDGGTVSAAQLTPAGTFVSYLNATPRQGDETLADWPGFRVAHLLDDNDSSATKLGQARGIKFLGGTGTCVMDTYVTKAKSNHYIEIACFVQGRTKASVIVAAAPSAEWPSVAPVLRRALAAYRVQ
jgi:hypothetical protein